MRDQELRFKTHLAVWAAVSMTLIPLLPYALAGG
jgi:hypothetical protein